MNEILTIGEIGELTKEDLQGMMTEQNVKDLLTIGITTTGELLDMLKDDATLSGLEDDTEWLSVQDYIEKLINKHNAELPAQSTGNVISFSQNRAKSTTKKEVITNITDKKKIFNLGRKIDKLLNECEGQELTIKEVLIKRFEKPMRAPILDEETGEVIKDTETSMSCVIVDENGTSYATGSKVFTIDLMNCIEEFGEETLKEGLKIKILKQERGDSKNKSLTFELL